MATWQNTLLIAAEASSDLRNEMEQVVAVIESALRDTLDATRLRSLIGVSLDEHEPLPKYLPRPAIIVALEAAARGDMHHVSSEVREALWAALRGLPRVLDSLSLSLYGAPITVDGISESLDRITRKPDERSSNKYQCPRCGSRQVSAHREKTIGVVIIELKCERCGLANSLNEGDPTDMTWVAESASESDLASMQLGGVRGHANDDE